MQQSTRMLVVLGTALTIIAVIAVGALCCPESAEACHRDGRHITGPTLTVHTTAPVPSFTPAERTTAGFEQAAAAVRALTLDSSACPARSTNAPLRI